MLPRHSRLAAVVRCLRVGGRWSKRGLTFLLRYLVYDPNGALILNVPVTFVTDGNIQAHVDQH
ncbi:hypothetical protein SBA5_920019 [Candidatus Sulfotelmatomonas gaucii]|uniref:Uncharacterized protein n=1 Tax=Candidatus Sulfuritelmatomonas gaucii TaxID=2043161 RepID=A0A2N9M964_9BACT|nr:hypothetical protein SBA5_920019 [Candidatus Sulfotelmatomonas gaucii]